MVTNAAASDARDLCLLLAQSGRRRPLSGVKRTSGRTHLTVRRRRRKAVRTGAVKIKNPKAPAVKREVEEGKIAFRANAVEWMARMAGRLSFECRIHSPYDLPDTAEKWRRCSVVSPPPGAADTTAHFEPARDSHSVFQRLRG
jgi:hypothetical protein